jgi:hypothetical protein
LRKAGIYKKEGSQTKLFPGFLRAIPFSGAGMDRDAKRNGNTNTKVSLTWLLRCVYKLKRLLEIQDKVFAGMF